MVYESDVLELYYYNMILVYSLLVSLWCSYFIPRGGRLAEWPNVIAQSLNTDKHFNFITSWSCGWVETITETLVQNLNRTHGLYERDTFMISFLVFFYSIVIKVALLHPHAYVQMLTLYCSIPSSVLRFIWYVGPCYVLSYVCNTGICHHITI